LAESVSSCNNNVHCITRHSLQEVRCVIVSYISIFILDTVCQSITDLFTVTIEIMGYTSTVKTFSSHTDVLMIPIEYSSSLLCDAVPTEKGWT